MIFPFYLKGSVRIEAAKVAGFSQENFAYYVYSSIMTEEQTISVDLEESKSSIFFKANTLRSMGIFQGEMSDWTFLTGISRGRISFNKNQNNIIVNFYLIPGYLMAFAAFFALITMAAFYSGLNAKFIMNYLGIWYLVTSFGGLYSIWKFRTFIKECAIEAPQIRYWRKQDSENK